MPSEKRKAQLREANARFKERYPERSKEYKAKSKLKNPEMWTAQQRKDNQKAYARHGEKRRALNKAWREQNADYIYNANALRRERSKRATPIWDEEFTSFVFAEARMLAKLRKKITGFSWHVDHIVPLKGKKVSGFHIWNNFRVIPAKLNLSKHNLF